MPNPQIPDRPFVQSSPALPRVTHRFRLAFLPGALLAAALVAVPSPAESPQVRADTLVTREIAQKPFTFQSGRAWRLTAESLERRRNWNGVLRHLERVIARESGSGRAEARLWRGAFVYRHGLEDKAWAVFDSLLDESSHYSILLAAPIAENAWRAALATERPAAALRALDAWRLARRQLAELGLQPGPAGEAAAYGDSLYAEACLQAGRLYLKWDRNHAAGREAVERALNAGLPRVAVAEARLLLGRLADADGAHEPAADELGQVVDEQGPTLPAALVQRLQQARADAEYNAGRFDAARRHYDELLPGVSTAPDSQWLLMQCGDAAHRAGDDRTALARYADYLKSFPHGTWADWVQFSRGDTDTTGVDS